MGRKEADEPKLTLQLSGTTFLDTAVLDAFTGRTLYIAETRGRDTYLLLITQDGQAKLQTASQVHWPKTKAKEGPSRIRVQMGSGRWWESEQFLKYGSVFTSRKFNLPRYPHQLKWKKVGSVYHCLSANLKRPVAILDPATLSSPARLRIYESLVSPDPTRPAANYADVPLILIDYLYTTALLVVTDAEEWMNVPDVPTIHDGDPRFAPGANPVQDWRQQIGSRPPPSVMSSGSGSNDAPPDSPSGSSDFPMTPASAVGYSHLPVHRRGSRGDVPPMPNHRPSTSSRMSISSASSSHYGGVRNLPLPPPMPPLPPMFIPTRSEDRPWEIHHAQSGPEGSTDHFVQLSPEGSSPSTNDRPPFFQPQLQVTNPSAPPQPIGNGTHSGPASIAAPSIYSVRSTQSQPSTPSRSTFRPNNPPPVPPTRVDTPPSDHPFAMALAGPSHHAPSHTTPLSQSQSQSQWHDDELDGSIPSFSTGADLGPVPDLAPDPSISTSSSNTTMSRSPPQRIVPQRRPPPAGELPLPPKLAGEMAYAAQARRSGSISLRRMPSQGFSAQPRPPLPAQPLPPVPVQHQQVYQNAYGRASPVPGASGSSGRATPVHISNGPSSSSANQHLMTHEQATEALVAQFGAQAFFADAPGGGRGETMYEMPPPAYDQIDSVPPPAPVQNGYGQGYGHGHSGSGGYQVHGQSAMYGQPGPGEYGMTLPVAPLPLVPRRHA